ncbi:MAG: trypsin-like peptidase domain-containing protein [Chloroflexota bacterium]
MSAFRLHAIAVVSAVTMIGLTAGCGDLLRSGTATPTTAPAPAAQAPTAAAATPATTPQAPAPPAAQPAQSPGASQGAASPGGSPVTTAAKPADGAVASAPVAPAAQPAQAAPGAAPNAAPPAQLANPYDAAIKVYRDGRPSVVTVISSVVQPGFRSDPEPAGTGSGFMIDDQGHILTNNHVVADADKLEITLANGTTLPAELVGRDARFDIAVIKANIPRDQLRVMSLGDSDQVQVGEQAIAIGNPYGLDGTVTTGIVSGRRPLVAEPNDGGQGDGVLVNAIQTDTSINPGNSGGPLLNARGEVIGVNTLGLMPNRAQTGLNFAIPINNAKRILPDLLSKGSYSHPFVGISTAEITSQVASSLSLPVQEGLIVQTVEPNSGAGRAGLRGGGQQAREIGSRQVAPGGDIIVSIDGRKVRRPEDLIAYLELNKKAGETVTLSISRDGQQREVQVTLGERPQPSARPATPTRR